MDHAIKDTRGTYQVTVEVAGEEASLTWVAWDRDDFEPDPSPPRSPRR